MKSKLIFVFIISIGIGVLLFFINQKNVIQNKSSTTPILSETLNENEQIHVETEKSDKNQKEFKNTKTKLTSDENKTDKTDLKMEPALNDKEIESISLITKAVGQALSKKMNSTDFMKLLTQLSLKPKFMDQGNSALGSFVTIRTHNTLDGTRYIHAQFTGEHQKADYLQHFSFQIRPGSDSFEQANKLLNQVLPKDRKIKESYNDYTLYTTADGYVAWVKIANSEDLRSNKYNAYSAEDIGSVIVTIEQEIHGMDEEH